MATILQKVDNNAMNNRLIRNDNFKFIKIKMLQTVLKSSLAQIYEFHRRYALAKGQITIRQ